MYLELGGSQTDSVHNLYSELRWFGISILWSSLDAMSDDFKSEMKNQVTWTCKTNVLVRQEASSAKKRKKRVLNESRQHHKTNQYCW